MMATRPDKNTPRSSPVTPTFQTSDSHSPLHSEYEVTDSCPDAPASTDDNSTILACPSLVFEALPQESPSTDLLPVGDSHNHLPLAELKCIQEWSRGSRASYEGKPHLVHDLVTQGKTPSQLDTVALWCLAPPLKFTYQELIIRAQLVAQRLVTLCSPVTFVILFFQRSPAFVVSMLGTLMAGKTCVPMDATHTSMRLVKMKQQLGKISLVVLTSQEHHATAENHFSNDIVICVDDLVEPGVNTVSCKGCHPAQVNPTDLAFVYFTSGSAGKPKAVPERHESVVNYILGACDVLSLPSECRFLQAMNIGFDSSLLELFATFYLGGTVVLPTKNLMDSLGNVDTCMLTPSMLYAIGDPFDYPNLRVVISVGEPLAPSLAKRWCQAEGEQVRLFNAYGPTETVVTSHFEHVIVTRDDSLVTIGRTIPNVQCYILDDTLHMLSVGEIGEICISGIGVCNSYLNDEQRSRDVFVVNPFGSGMLYRTGDLGYWLPDGRVCCMGRKDNQIKRRGFRIELGEIEEAIRNSKTMENLHNVCVAYDQDRDKLVGFLTPIDVESDQLLSELRKWLPLYMIPDCIVPMDRFPLTANGKVNRQLLLTDHIPIVPKTTGAASMLTRTPIQHKLVTILCDMFQLDEDKVHLHHDTFFTLGGNSISAMYFVSRCKANGIKIAMTDITHQATISTLADCASESMGETTRDLHSSKFTQGPFTLTPIQRMYLGWSLGEPSHWPLPLLLKLTTPRTLDEWHSIVTTLVSHHDMLRARFDRTDGEWRGRILSIDDDPVKINQVVLDDETSYWGVMDKAHREISSTTGPIYVAYVMNHSNTQYFYLVMHHLIGDNMSINILTEDVCTLLDGQPLPKQTLPYALWSQNMEGLRDIVHMDPNQLPCESELVLPPSDDGQMLYSESDQHNHFTTSTLDMVTTLALDQFGHRDISAEDIILMGLLLAYTDTFKCTSIPLQYLSHGRNALGNPWDVSHTVGFFIAVCHVILRREKSDDLAAILRKVQTSLNGVSDLAIKCMLTGHTMMAPVGYNFFGKPTTSYSPKPNGVEVIHVSILDDYQKLHISEEPMDLAFLADYTHDCLLLGVSYKPNLYSFEFMTKLAEEWKKCVQEVVAWLQSQ